MTAIPGYSDEEVERVIARFDDWDVGGYFYPSTRAANLFLAAIRQCQANAIPDAWAEDDSIGKAFKILLDWAMGQWRQIQPLAERVQAIMDEEAAKKVLIEDEP